MVAIQKGPINLPLELKYHVISFLDQSELAAVSRTNWTLNVEAERLLYRDVRIMQDAPLERFKDALDRDLARARRVRSAHIADFGVSHYAVVHSLLKSMPNLQSLTILPAFSEAEVGEYWDALLEDVDFDFKLLEFVTSLDCDRGLTRFLLRQTQLERYIHSGYTPTHSIDLLRDPLVLPSLKRFVGNVMDLNIIIPHREVTHVTVQETIAAIGLSLFVLGPLRRSKGPILHLSLSLMDHAEPETLQAISHTVPSLLSLHLALPCDSRGAFSSATSWGDALPPGVRHLALEALDSHFGMHSELNREDQADLVKRWSLVRPTLSQIQFIYGLASETGEPFEAMCHSWTCLRPGAWTYSSTRKHFSEITW